MYVISHFIEMPAPVLLLQYAMLSLNEQGKPDPGQFTMLQRMARLDHGDA
jgi:hypothetical protein